MNTHLLALSLAALLFSFQVFSQKNNSTATAEDFFKRGLEAHQNGSLDDAIGFYNAALGREAEHSGALFNRAMARFSKNQYTKSGADLDAYLRLQPSDRDALERRGYVFYLLKNYDEAIKMYTRALAIAAAPRIHLNRGVAFYDNGDPENALTDFQSALRTDDSLSEAWLGAGNCWMAMGDYEKAESIFREAIRRGDNQPEMLYNLAMSLVKMRKYNAALEPLNKILATRDHAAALAQRAFCQFKLGNFDKAESDSERANNLDIRVPFSYHTLGLLALRGKKFEAAERLFSEGLAWQKGQAELLAARGYARYRMQQLDLATEDLNFAIEINPLLGEAFYTRASVKHVAGSQVDACNDYRQAVSLGYEPFTEEDGSPFCEGVVGEMEPKK